MEILFLKNVMKMSKKSQFLLEKGQKKALD
jgi:hypothetical protein